MTDQLRREDDEDEAVSCHCCDHHANEATCQSHHRIGECVPTCVCHQCTHLMTDHAAGQEEPTP